MLEWASAKGVSGRDEAGGCGQEEPSLGVCVVAITDVVEHRAWMCFDNWDDDFDYW